MNKAELIAKTAEVSGLSKKDTEKALAAAFDTIISAVAEGEKVQIVGFGSFEQRVRSERTGCDPRTGAKITIPETKTAAFKVGKVFKESVAK